MTHLILIAVAVLMVLPFGMERATREDRDDDEDVRHYRGRLP